MTALVTGVALIPLALGVGQPGKGIQQPMAIVILGGIFTSTFLNMIVIPIPTLYLKYGSAEAPSPARDYPKVESSRHQAIDEKCLQFQQAFH